MINHLLFDDKYVQNHAQIGVSSFN